MGQQAGTPMAGTLEGDGYFFQFMRVEGRVRESSIISIEFTAECW
jgi:hypothetical protein